MAQVLKDAAEASGARKLGARASHPGRCRSRALGLHREAIS
jgi:hypothetical protein